MLAIALDPVWRRLAAGLPERRWSAVPVDPPLVLGAVTAGVAALLVLSADPAWLAMPEAALAPIIVLGGAVDIRHHRLPNPLTACATVVLAALVTVAAAAEGDASIALGAIAGAALFAGVLFIVHLASPAGMGFGDVKFGVPLGLVVGADRLGGVLVALAIGAMLGALAGAVVLARHRDRHRAFAFGPYLAAGAVLALLVGG